MSDQQDNLTRPFDPNRDATYQPNDAGEQNAAGAAAANPSEGGHTGGISGSGAAGQRFADWLRANPGHGPILNEGTAALLGDGTLLYLSNHDGTLSRWQPATA